MLSCSVMSNCSQSDGLSPPGSSVHRLLKAGILEWVAISFSSRWAYGPRIYLSKFPVMLILVDQGTYFLGTSVCQTKGEIFTTCKVSLVHGRPWTSTQTYFIPKVVFQGIILIIINNISNKIVLSFYNMPSTKVLHI